MVAVKNYTWHMGDDLLLAMVYRMGAPGEEQPIDLTNWSVRMDIALPGDDPLPTPLLTLNSDPLEAQPTLPNGEDDLTEITLGEEGEIRIEVSRQHTLPGSGALWNAFEDGARVLNYDIFLRNSLDKQRKILRGTITLEPSVTLWT